MTRLRQIVLNLLSNAVKFTGQGEVVLRLSGRALENDAYELHCSVRDTGIGISPEGMKRLFQNFGQAGTDTTRRYGGTGLGLAISKRLAELHGGMMTVESEPGRGSTFSFTLRMRRAASRTRAEQPMTWTSRWYASIASMRASRRRARLLVDHLADP